MQAIQSTDFFSSWTPNAFSLICFGIVVFGIVAVLLVLSSWIGERKPTREKLRAYESGIIPTGDARIHYPVPFFMVAVFFLIFDVEGVFIFSWAIAAKTLGILGWLQITFFIFVLIIGLLYVWRKGGLEWGGKAHQK